MANTSEIPEHIVKKAEAFMKKAGVPGDHRKIRFVIADHILFIESLGGKVKWPEEKVVSPPGVEPGTSA